LGSPMPSLPEIGCRSASRTRLRTAYETARTPGLPASVISDQQSVVSNQKIRLISDY
jgi:hypothetical protein